MSGFDVVCGHATPSAEEGMALTFFTNAMQKGYGALQQMGLPKHEVRAACQDIKNRSEAIGKLDDPDVQALLTKLGKLLPEVEGGGWS